MMFSIVLVTFCLTSAVSGQRDREFRLGLLLPEYQPPPMRYWPYFRQMVQPGIDIAIGKINDTILPGYNFTYQWQDTKCSNQLAMIYTVSMRYQFECDVFFGPACEYAVAPTARFCDYWEVPLITAGAMAQGFSKSFFTSITRMQGSYDKFAYFVLHFFKLNDWNKTMLLWDEPTTSEIRDCHFCIGGVAWTLGVIGRIPHEVEAFNERTLDNDAILKLLGKVKANARSKFLYFTFF